MKNNNEMDISPDRKHFTFMNFLEAVGIEDLDRIKFIMASAQSTPLKYMIQDYLPKAFVTKSKDISFCKLLLRNTTING